MAYSTRRFVLSLAFCYFVLVCVFLELREKANLSAFRTFVRFALVWFCLFLFLLFGFVYSSSSWCLGRAAAGNCGTPWTFPLPFFVSKTKAENGIKDESCK